MLFYLPLAGSTFKKVYYDAMLERAVSKFIPAEDLVVPYYATNLKEAPRITHVIKQSENDLLKKMSSGFYREVELQKPQKKDDKVQDKYNELEGIKAVQTTDSIYTILEMHVDLDLSDYIAENEEDKINIKIPYIVTIEESTRKILSIYRNYKEDDPKFIRKEYPLYSFQIFTRFRFLWLWINSHDRWPVTNSNVRSRQLLDAGTLSIYQQDLKQEV